MADNQFNEYAVAYSHSHVSNAQYLNSWAKDSHFFIEKPAFWMWNSNTWNSNAFLFSWINSKVSTFGIHMPEKICITNPNLFHEFMQNSHFYEFFFNLEQKWIVIILVRYVCCHSLGPRLGYSQSAISYSWINLLVINFHTDLLNGTTFIK